MATAIFDSATTGRAPARFGGWPVAVALAIAVASAALLFWALGDPLIAAAFLAGLVGVGAIFLLRAGAAIPAVTQAAPDGIDIVLLRAALDTATAGVAITDRAGAMIAANQCYVGWFGGDVLPNHIPAEDEGEAMLGHAPGIARRDGFATLPSLRVGDLLLDVRVEPAGAGGSHLLWRFTRADDIDLVRDALRLVTYEGGRRLGEAGLMAALVDGAGRVIGANAAFAARAMGQIDGDASGKALVEMLFGGDDGALRFVSEGRSAAPLHLIQIPLSDGLETPCFFLMLDDPHGGFGRLGKEESASVNALVDFLPLGLALADVDGRFVYMNKAFRRAAGLGRDEMPIYPGDLVVDVDKAALSDSVRRLARGPATSSSISLRLSARPEESVPVTIAGVRGLGEAAVILALKDSSEEDRLKHQVAQATKMQAVGQLAGGVAHDFNNILTAIIGHCDLMLMRHTPGDSDYDDIQQIRSNSNRAAGLTRQLLAFSRQQTLRPQVLQLPDVISEVSTLLKRLMGETVKLQVKHGRNLGAVRADPGQLEQVIVNLAVNARDAMPGGGTLIIQTYAMPADEVRKLGYEFLPIGDYTALKVSDTGTGIPQRVLPKIFEPFFTTKEVGKGTGLGLSTVYGIVKQSGGYIFADSEEGVGTSFTIYLPVNRAELAPMRPKPAEEAGELWGSGTVLLVEDEAMVRAVAERALTRHGYTVLTAENGEAALEILAGSEQIDLMISDVVMPTMDGPTTVRAARKSHPDLPILFISGYAEEQLRKSIDLERVAFLSKPFSIQRLAEAARDALAQK